MAKFTSRRIAVACFGIAALTAAHAAVAADFPDPSGPGPEEAGPPPDYSPERGPSRIYREQRVEEEAPPGAERTPYGPRFAAGPRYAPPPPPMEECRTIVRHRVNAYGEEIRRRIRICDERAPVEPGPRFRQSGYGPGPIPPADIPEGPYGDPRGY